MIYILIRQDVLPEYLRKDLSTRLITTQLGYVDTKEQADRWIEHFNAHSRSSDTIHDVYPKFTYITMNRL